MTTPSNANESYCTFTLASDVTAGGLPSQEEIAKDLESSDASVRIFSLVEFSLSLCLYRISTCALIAWNLHRG
jgi:hypothetical protein